MRKPERNLMNKVPPETVIRHMAKERDKLEAEIADLKAQLVRKDEAIAAFKKWQSKVAEYKWEFWLREGIKLMETPPDAEMLHTLKNLLGCHRIFQSWEKKVTTAWQQYKKAYERAAKLLKPQDNEETVQTDR